MDVLEALWARRSVRAYKPDPVPRDVLENILKAAVRAPTWGCTQPWEFALVGGKVMEELKDALLDKLSQGVQPNPDMPYPRTFPEPQAMRRRQNGIALFTLLGIGRDDHEKRRAWTCLGQRFFEAPNGIILYMDASLGPWSLLDLGMVMQSIMLAALNYGLGTCPQAAVVRYPDELRRILGIPPTKKIVCGMAIGYPDPEAPQNRHRSQRAPLEEVSTWHGF